jgi:hypothetical protein
LHQHDGVLGLDGLTVNALPLFPARLALFDEEPSLFDFYPTDTTAMKR